MYSLVRRSGAILRAEGPKSLALRAINYLYRRTIAPLLPRRAVQYNGIDVPAVQLFDALLPWRPCEDRPHYESGLVSALRQHVDPGDEVVIVGGGWGVTAVVAAEQVGDAGSVTVYEGSQREVERVRRTADWNGFSDFICVEHAVVGTALNLRGDRGDAAVVAPADLPACDVLELDCEGAEVEILEQLPIDPKTILVETHGCYGAPTKTIRSILQSRSYVVVSTELADLGLRQACTDNDIRVISLVHH